MIAFEVLGTPAPQGSKRHVGGGRMIESSKKVRPWREDVRHAAMRAMAGPSGSNAPLKGPLYLRVVFTLQKPKSAPKGRTTFPERKPDIDKLLRSTMDALTSAGVWVDDAQVIHCTAVKAFPFEHAEALKAPGARVFVGYAT